MKNRTTLFLAVLIAAVFVTGIVRLFVLRFEAGDVYPPYSTLRTDPLGGKAFFMALKNLPGIEAGRSLRPVSRLKPDSGTTFFIAGLGVEAQWDEEEVGAVETFAHAGGRVVVTFLPTLEKPEPKATPTPVPSPKPAVKTKPTPAGKTASTPAEAKKERRQKPEEDDEGNKKSVEISLADLAKRWGMEIDYFMPAAKDAGKPMRAERAGSEPGDAQLSWHSRLFFRRPGKPWRTLYACDGRPVLVERAWGKGTIVLASDSYFLSNEAMRRERHPALLAWLAGPNRRVVFDETHFGIGENPGIATLVRRYRLHGVVLALAVLAALFVWKNASCFLPPHETEADGGEIVAGRDSAEGFVNLLRRSVPQRELMKTCVAEWKRAFGHRSGFGEKLRQIETIAAETQSAKARDAVEAYRRIARALAMKTKR